MRPWARTSTRPRTSGGPGSPRGRRRWCLKVPSLQALYELKVIAERQGISTALIQDAGLTEVEPGTVTALGLGPARSEVLDRVTGGLSLL